MKKIFGILLALCLLLGCCSVFAEEPAAPALTKNLIVLFTSDVHCGIDSGAVSTAAGAMPASTP